MADIFSFPVRGLEHPSEVTLACFATHLVHEDDFIDEVRKFCDKTSPPDNVLLIGPLYVEDKLTKVRQSTRFQSRLPGASRYVDPPPVAQICFGSAGLQNCGFKDVDKIVHAGLMTLFTRHGGLIKGSSAFHYIKPSGRHCDAFLRTANVLVCGVEIEFIAACCLANCPRNMTRIYTDTGAIHSIAFALLRLLSKFGDERSESLIDSFGSYNCLNDFSFADAARSLILISASTSGRLVADVVAREPQIRREHISTIYFLGDEANSKNVLCHLLFHPTDNPEGFDAIRSYSAESCPLCVGSTAVRMSEEQFIPQGPQVEPILIQAKDAPEATSTFFSPLVGRGIFRANYREVESSSASREIYLDLLPMFSTALFCQIEGFQTAFERHCSHLVSANTKRIVHLNDKASKFLAGRIATFANQHNVVVDILSAKDLQDKGVTNPQQGGTTIVAASAISTGRGLSEVSKSLRFAQHGGAIKYLIVFSRPKSQSLSQDVQRHLSYGDNGPREHSVSIMHEFFLPSWRPEGRTAWEDEFELLSNTFDPCPSELNDRKESLRRSASAMVRGLNDDLFLPSRCGIPLKLRPSFAFWKFDYSEARWGPDRRPSQADVYATISAILHNLREGKRTNERSLRQADHVRKVISPRCFERFNDGIIQACLLRGAHFAELDYSAREDLSEDMRNIISTILDQASTSVGEAANEFLLAIALGRLRLCGNNIASLYAEYGAPSTDATELYLWTKIKKRYGLD